jgi:hypothetical protein
MSRRNATPILVFSVFQDVANHNNASISFLACLPPSFKRSLEQTNCYPTVGTRIFSFSTRLKIKLQGAPVRAPHRCKPPSKRGSRESGSLSTTRVGSRKCVEPQFVRLPILILHRFLTEARFGTCAFVGCLRLEIGRNGFKQLCVSSCATYCISYCCK